MRSNHAWTANQAISLVEWWSQRPLSFAGIADSDGPRLMGLSACRFQQAHCGQIRLLSALKIRKSVFIDRVRMPRIASSLYAN